MRQAAATRAADRLSYTFSLSFEIVLFFLILSLYTTAYAVGEREVALALPVAVWTLVIGRVMNTLGEQALAWRMSEEIASGKVELFINRPLGYVPTCFARYFGQAGLSLVPFIVILPLLGFLWVGWPPVSLLSLPSLFWFLVLFLLGFAVRALLFLTLGLSAFWTENAGPLIGIVRKIFMLFSGSFFPLQFLTGAFRTSVELSPFGASAAATFLFEPTFSHDTWRYVAAQLVWVLVFGALSATLWHFAQRRLFVNGG